MTPFLAGGQGHARGSKKADQFTDHDRQLQPWSTSAAACSSRLKKRLTIRGDVRHYVIFDPNHTQRIQEYSGALAIPFLGCSP